MNHEPAATPRERLIEVLLEETLRPAGGAQSAITTPTAHRSPWLAAAIALLGIGVVGAVFASRVVEPAATQTQDPKPTQPWLRNVHPIRTQADWDAWAPQVDGVMLRLLRTSPGGTLETIDEATEYVSGPAARELAAKMPALSELPFAVADVDSENPPFAAWIAFESRGMQVHGFVRVWSQPTLAIGNVRASPPHEAWQQAVQLLFAKAAHRQEIAQGVVTTLEELVEVPASARAIRCPPPRNGSLLRHLGRFRDLEHLELVDFSGVLDGRPISIPLPELPTTLLSEMMALPKLEHLRVSALLLHTDERLAELAQLPALESLHIDGNLGGGMQARGSFTAMGMRGLARKLVALELDGAVGPTDLLEPLLEAGLLRQLVITCERGGVWSPELLARFVRLPTLTRLGLRGTGFGDAHLQALAGSKLTWLRLIGTEVSAAGLAHLPTGLLELDLRRQPDVDAEAILAVTTRLPGCHIRQPGEPDDAPWHGAVLKPNER